MNFAQMLAKKILYHFIFEKFSKLTILYAVSPNINVNWRYRAQTTLACPSIPGKFESTFITDRQRRILFPIQTFEKHCLSNP